MRHAHQCSLSLITRALADKKGAAAVVYAVAMPVLVGFAGLGVEAGSWYMVRRQAQTAADAGAISGAVEVAFGRSGTLVEQSAHAEAKQNGFENGVGATTVAIAYPYAGSSKTVAVDIRQVRPNMLASLFMQNDVSVEARAVAQVQEEGSACMLALGQIRQDGFGIGGTAALNASGCYLASNATGATAIDIYGSAIVNAGGLIAAGGIEIDNPDNVTVPPGSILPGAFPVANPFSDLLVDAESRIEVEEAAAGCNKSNDIVLQAGETLSVDPTTKDKFGNPYFKKITTMSPSGYYVICGGIKVGGQASLTLSPGTYYLVGGDFEAVGSTSTTAGATIYGDGVTLVLTAKPGFTAGNVIIRGGASVNLTAPTTGYYAGIVIMQDPLRDINKNMTAGSTDSRLNGGSTTTLNGTIYLPKASVDVNGHNTSSTNDCSQLVADVINLSGSANFNVNPCSTGGGKSPKVITVKLIE